MFIFFKVSFQNPDDIDISLEGFKSCVRVSSLFYMDTERDSFLCGLAKLTSLEDSSRMTSKNIKIVLCLIDIAITDGNYLRDSWTTV